MPYAGENATASVMTIGFEVGSTPLNTNLSGTATSGTTETFDAILGYYQVTLVAGHQYQAVVNGLIGNGSVVADVFTVQIRDSGSTSNPTSASTLIAQQEWYCSAAGSAGRSAIPLAMVFTASTSGTHTFGVSAVRAAGTGVFTPVGFRQLYVEDKGGN